MGNTTTATRSPGIAPGLNTGVRKDMSISDYVGVQRRALDGDREAIATMMKIATSNRSFFRIRARDALASIGIKVVTK